ncbi:MAG: hypothetical protein R3Y35_06730 [Clostridia bacterium]
MAFLISYAASITMKLPIGMPKSSVLVGIGGYLYCLIICFSLIFACSKPISILLHFWFSFGKSSHNTACADWHNHELLEVNS